MSLPETWLIAATMARVIMHWTGGAHVISLLYRQHYHLIGEGDGNVVRGDRPISANQAPIRGNYAAHTLDCDSSSISIDLSATLLSVIAARSPLPAGEGAK